MSSSISSLMFISKQVSIYMGIPILVGGVLGGLLNTIVFLSLRTFRQSSCVFYLTIMSITNIGQLLTGLLTRIMITGFGIDWTQSSLFYCKFRNYCLQLCGLLSLTCYCLATIDQYFATCSRPRWQQWCTIKMACRLCAISLVIWVLHGIVFLVYYDLTMSLPTGTLSCRITNPIFAIYITYGYQLLLSCVLPVFISSLFGFLAYRNVTQLTHRTVPLVRRELDKQLTKMILLQNIINAFVVVPNMIIFVTLAQISASNNGSVPTNIDFVNQFTTHIYYLYFANPFFIYICISNRFRRQLVYVLFEIYFHRWQRQGVAVNQIGPQT